MHGRALRNRISPCTPIRTPRHTLARARSTHAHTHPSTQACGLRAQNQTGPIKPDRPADAAEQDGSRVGPAPPGGRVGPAPRVCVHGEARQRLHCVAAATAMLGLLVIRTRRWPLLILPQPPTSRRDADELFVPRPRRAAAAGSESAMRHHSIASAAPHHFIAAFCYIQRCIADCVIIAACAPCCFLLATCALRQIGLSRSQ